MRKIAMLPAAAAMLGVLLGAAPADAGCMCKTTRDSWCAKTCEACAVNQAAPVGRCTYWYWRRTHRS